MNISILNNNIIIKREYPVGVVSFLKTLNRKNLIGVEIGVFKGMNAHSILSELDIKKLYLVDSYEDYPGYLDYMKLHGEIISEGSQEKFESIAKKRLESFKEKVVWIKKKSSDALDFIKEEVDFVYIDGNHKYEYVKEDIEKYYQILKKGGILSGDDFDNSLGSSHHGVVKAVLEFLISMNSLHKLKLYEDNWWFTK